MATIVVVGAGIAGLACGQALRRLGHGVIWLEKSRGVGGRMATRRLSPGAWADHGLRYWSELGLERLTQELVAAGVVFPWAGQSFGWCQGRLMSQTQLRYCTDSGINAIAKYLAIDATVHRQQRVVGLEYADPGWQLTAEGPQGTTQPFKADAVVLAIPAPQVIPLWATLEQPTAADLNAVEYAPGLSLMATYHHLPESPPLNHHQGWCITAEHPVLAWLSLESSKPKTAPGVHSIVFQSQPDFAAHHLEQLAGLASNLAAVENLQQATTAHLLAAAAEILPGLGQHPQTHRLHRWRYSIVRKTHPQPWWQTPWTTLVGCGDWCGLPGEPDVTRAYGSGIAAAEHLQSVI